MAAEDDETPGPPDAGEPEHEHLDAADPAQAKRYRRLADRDRAEGDAFWRTVLGDPIGRREVWRFLVSTHAFEDRFAVGPGGFPQSEATWFQAGEAATGRRLYRSLLRIDHAAVHMMHAEWDAEFGGGKPKKRQKAEE